VVDDLGNIFRTAWAHAVVKGEMTFTDEFWHAWDDVYRDLTRDRPDTKADEATARGVAQVLRLALLYALFDDTDMAYIDKHHLDAAVALWAYCEASARWLFSTHELEQERESHGTLAAFILEGGSRGRTRTEISRDHFKGNADKAQIDAELVVLVHDGTVVEEKIDGKTRKITRYVHRSLRTNDLTKDAGSSDESRTFQTKHVRTNLAATGDSSSDFVDSLVPETRSDLHSSSNSLIRTCRCGEALREDNTTVLCAECTFIARQEAVASAQARLNGAGR
jgi:hypothetical protein